MGEKSIVELESDAGMGDGEMGRCCKPIWIQLERVELDHFPISFVIAGQKKPPRRQETQGTPRKIKRS